MGFQRDLSLWLPEAKALLKKTVRIREGWKGGWLPCCIMNKIAIFGGTFNPIHNGHINLCRQCQALYQFDKILLIPTNLPPHKQAEQLAPNQARLDMIQLAVSDFPYLEGCDIEFELGAKSYTIRTILALKKRYPESRFYLIIGSDMFLSFVQWRQYEQILKEVTLVVGARHADEMERLIQAKNELSAFSAQIEIVNIHILELSSTEIRNRMKNKQEILSLIDEKVAAYIQEHHLYQREGSTVYDK